MRPFGSPKQLEKRRRKAMDVLDTGLSLNAVARQLNCDPSSVMRWRDQREIHGDPGLKPKPVPGRPSKLTARQKKRLIAILTKGAIRNGYRTDLWTTARIAEIIQANFGVTYHRDHIGRLMSTFNWSYQKPQKRALEQDEARIEKWKQEAWPRIKKTPKTWAPTSCSSTNQASC
jgi:transposase